MCGGLDERPARHSPPHPNDQQADPLAALRGLLDGLGEEEGDSAEFASLDAENGLIRAALSGALNKNFFSAGMGLDRLLRCVRVCMREANLRPTPCTDQLLIISIPSVPSSTRGRSSISPQEADDVFTLFPPVQKMPAWQAFLAQGSSSGGNDAEAVRSEKKSGVGGAAAVMYFYSHTSIIERRRPPPRPGPCRSWARPWGRWPRWAPPLRASWRPCGASRCVYCRGGGAAGGGGGGGVICVCLSTALVVLVVT